MPFTREYPILPGPSQLLNTGWAKSRYTVYNIHNTVYLLLAHPVHAYICYRLLSSFQNRFLLMLGKRFCVFATAGSNVSKDFLELLVE